MKKIKVILTALFVVAAIGGAFATSFLVPEPAYLNEAELPEPPSSPSCVEVGTCEGTGFDCVIEIQNEELDLYREADTQSEPQILPCTVKLQGVFSE